MRIWILRHGQATPTADSDASRELTEAGRAEVVGMLQQLTGEPLDGVLASPYRRAQQTAELAQRELNYDREIETVAWLTPDASPVDVLRKLAERDESDLLLVSHQPLVGQLISLLLDGHKRGHYPMPTAGLACLEAPLAVAGAASLISLSNPSDS